MYISGRVAIKGSICISSKALFISPSKALFSQSSALRSEHAQKATLGVRNPWG